MKSISKLKDEARRYEQREEWEKAIQAYLQVLRIADEGETEVELPLYNRLGDLCVRLGKPQEAVRHYEQAADRYAEAGLYNNAIALCNKALRYNPDRPELIRKLGQFSASQGFISDARRYFLDYAERQFNAGKVPEALNALEDFANVSDDADVREMLGRQLHAHGRTNDALDELRRAHALRLRDGQTQEAEAVRQAILAIDPAATLEGGTPGPAPAARPQEAAELPGLVDIEPDRPDAGAEDIGAAPIEGLEAGVLTDDGEVESVQLTGLETSESDLAFDPGQTDGIEGLETTSLDFAAVEPDTPALEDMGLVREDTSFGEAGGTSEPEAFDLPTLDEPSGSTDLPTLDEPYDSADLPTLDDPESTFDLPTLEEPDTQTDLPTLEPPRAAGGPPKRPRIDDVVVLPGDDDAGSIDLPLLGDDEPGGVEGEATPLPPPEIDDSPSLDLPGSADSEDFGLGGDLPLDLSSLGGSFHFPASGEDATAVPDWETGDTQFEVPEVEGDPLDLPTWEAEPGQTFEIPSFETEEEVPAGADEAAAGGESVPEADAAGDAGATAEAEAVEPLPLEADQEAADEEPSSVVSRPGAGDIPAIELPTWDTDGVAASDELEETEASEPSWVDSITDEDDATAELPTFTYDDDTAAEESVGSAADVDEETGDEVAQLPGAEAEVDAVSEDDDPLGLAAHLAARGGEHVPEMTARVEPESDWLDYISEDETDAGEDDVTGALESGDMDSAGDGGTAQETSVPEAARQDPSADTARARDAEREMAAAPPPGVEKPPAAPPPREDYVDLGALITGDDAEETTRFRVQETAPTGDEDRDFAELLSQFKSKVQEHLPPEDAGAHYDLGLAFKEMGLIDEAIGEFQIALRAGHMRLRVYEELGQCFMQKEQFNIAEKVLSRALTMKFEDELELLGVYYHLGRAYEALGRRDQARDAYERVLGMDINFGDVTDRLARL